MMNEFDDQIREALQLEHDEWSDKDSLDYEGVREMFRGYGRWLTIICVTFMAVMITMMVVSAVQFFQVESTRAMIAWATGFTVCVILEALIEFWFLAECRKNALQCQVKRLELQVAALARGMQTDEK